MQLEGMILILIMLIIIPVLAISGNDAAFFIVLSLVLSFSSLKNILITLFPSLKVEKEDKNMELLEEIEENIDLDFNKIEKGLKVIKALVIILFFIYSTFYLNLLVSKVLSSLIIVYWLNYVITTMRNDDEAIKEAARAKNSYIRQISSIVINALSFLIITITAYNRFFN